MTYTLKGKQYIVIAAGGHGKLGTKQGDYVLALPYPKFDRTTCGGDGDSPSRSQRC